MTYDMVCQQRWQCPEGLIEQALSEHPVTDEVVVLNKPTGDFFYSAWTIKDESKDTAWERILMSLTAPLGEARIITLKPGESYQSHADIDNRWHLNLTGEQSFLIDLESETMFKCQRDNSWYFMLTDRLHTACNFGSGPRMQLVVRELLRKPIDTSKLISVSIVAVNPAPDTRYKFDNVFSTFLNSANYNYKMSEFSFTDLLVTFKLAADLKEELERIKTTDFVVTYD